MGKAQEPYWTLEEQLARSVWLSIAFIDSAVNETARTRAEEPGDRGNEHNPRHPPHGDVGFL